MALSAAARHPVSGRADRECPCALSDLAISPDGRSLAASSGNGALTVWDADTGAVRLRVPDASAGHLAYTADGATLISARGLPTPEKGLRAATLQVRAWDASTGKEILARRLDLDAGEVGQHALTADGTALLGFTPDDKLRLRIWDLAKGGEIATLDALAADPSIERAMGHFMALSNDRKTLVWQILATTLVWDVPTKKIRLKHFQRHPGT